MPFRCLSCRQEAEPPNATTGQAWLGSTLAMPCGHRDAEFLPFPALPGPAKPSVPSYRLGIGVKT